MTFPFVKFTKNINIKKYNVPNHNNKRRLNVKKVNYMNEGYNLFRLEVSNFFVKNTNIKNKVIDIVRDTKIKTNDNYIMLKKILIKIKVN